MSKIDLSAAWVTSMMPRLFGLGIDTIIQITPVSQTGLLSGGVNAANVNPSWNHTSIKLMKGAVPVNFSDIPTITSRDSDQLVEFLSANGNMAPSQLTVNPAIISTIYKPATASGTATWFCWRTGSPNNGIIHSIYGTVGLDGSGADLIMPDTNIVIDEVYRIMNLQLRFPSSWTY